MNHNMEPANVGKQLAQLNQNARRLTGWLAQNRKDISVIRCTQREMKLIMAHPAIAANHGFVVDGDTVHFGTFIVRSQLDTVDSPPVVSKNVD